MIGLRFLPYALAFFSSFCIMILELVAGRLVARHVGASLAVWTSVIGIMLGGICLGNVLGGKLADRVEPRRAIGPLYALGAALTLGCLWVNAVVGYLPGLDYLQWDLRTILVVTLDFLVPGTVLGMIGPVVAKMAVEESKKSGSAIGDVYFMGAVGSIVGTFFAGFTLIYLAPTSTIVTLVGAALALLAVVMMAGSAVDLVLGLAAVAALGVGVAFALSGNDATPGFMLGTGRLNVITLLGHLLVFVLGARAFLRLKRDAARDEVVVEAEPTTFNPFRFIGDRLSGKHRARGLSQDPLSVDLADLAILSFVASLAFMALEMVAGRLVTRHLGSSIYGWTAVIGVLLGGLSVGNWLGGKIANVIRTGQQASWLFMAASVLTALILLTETPREWMVQNPIEYFFFRKPGIPLAGDTGEWLSQAIVMTQFPFTSWKLTWAQRVLFWVTVVFFLPSVAMGTVSPVVVKLAIERVRARSKATGAAIGQVYAWGMVGSIIGTFLTGFFLIDWVGTKGLLLVLATAMALAATVLGSVWHAAWAGIPLGLCVIAFLPALIPAGFRPLEKPRTWLVDQGVSWGLREEGGKPNRTDSGLAWVDESSYYFIKVSNQASDRGQKRTLVLDNLIHGYFILDHPEILDYDYEHIYAYVTHRAMQAKAAAAGESDVKKVGLNSLFLGGGSYTFPRYLRNAYPLAKSEVAEIDPAVTRTNFAALGLTRDLPIVTTWGDARQFVVKNQNKKFDVVFGDAFNDFSVPWHLTTREFNDKIANMLTPDGIYMINIIDIYRSDRKAALLGLYHSEVEAVAEALGGAGSAADRDTLARQVVLALDDEDLGANSGLLARTAVSAIETAGPKANRPELVSRISEAIGKLKETADSPPGNGEANSKREADRSVIRGAEEKIAEIAARAIVKAQNEDRGDGGGVDSPLAQAAAAKLGRAVAAAEIKFGQDPRRLAFAALDHIDEARGVGGFLSAWVRTAKHTFPYIYVFGTDDKPGEGLRETFVVVASRKALALNDLGERQGDPKFHKRDGEVFTPAPYSDEHIKALELRSRGITLTDDYAPVENLLAPVAATRGDD